MLLDLEVTAMGEMVLGTSSRKAFAILVSSRALTWDKVSTDPERFLKLVGWRCEYDHRVWSFWGQVP